MLDVRQSRELQAAILAMKAADRDLRLSIYKATRQELTPLWVPALNRRAATRMQQAVIVKGARIRVSTDGFSLMAATSRRALPGGLVPADEWAGSEFGARSRRAQIATHSRNGTPYTVEKMINRQYLARVNAGRVAFDAASELGTTAVRVWVRTIVDQYAAIPNAERSAG